MTDGTLLVLLLAVWLAVYGVVPAVFIVRGWVLRSGLVQLLGAVLPAIWQVLFWPNEIFTVSLTSLMIVGMLVQIPLGTILAGSALGLFRALTRQRRRTSADTSARGR